MSTPLISVLMPVYNGELYLAEAVESILQQTCTNFEFVIIDDGSSDASHDILRSYAANDPRIVLRRRPNTGIVGALNDGLSLCRGEFVARMDADDISLPERLETQLEHMQSHPECVLLGTPAIIISPDGVGLMVREAGLSHEVICERLLQGRGDALIHPVVMMRHAAVTAVGGYRKEFEVLEDLDLFLRLSEQGRVANLPTPLIKHRRLPTSLQAGRAHLQRTAQRRIVMEAFSRRGTDMPRRWRIHAPRRVEEYRKACDVALAEGNRLRALSYGCKALLCNPLARTTYRRILRACHSRTADATRTT